MSTSDPALLALALLSMDGVGRVTASRLLRAFGTYEQLRQVPYEQLRARLRGLRGADDLVGTLQDEKTMRDLLAKVAAERDGLRERGVHVLAPGMPTWPSLLDALAPAQRPAVLYAYGPLQALKGPCVAVLGRPPLSPEPFEQVQALVRHLQGGRVRPVAGVAHGLDVVIAKLAAGGASPLATLHVAHCGLAQVPSSMRPVASTSVRTGGMLISPFPMSHGPFEHDDKERALTQAALAPAAVFVEPQPDTPEWLAMEWALSAGRSVFGFAHADHPLPAAVHPIASTIDFDWVVAAATGVATPGLSD